MGPWRSVAVPETIFRAAGASGRASLLMMPPTQLT
jgi:hypothetical protein